VVVLFFAFVLRILCVSAVQYVLRFVVVVVLLLVGAGAFGVETFCFVYRMYGVVVFIRVMIILKY